ncbi:hypothetical protein [Ferriphaselus sp. R-1]|uniref:hypothetical protein n=1 Tax=Ferriphaselus sp. R-1 TaxID=1485544 RepID=UPI0012687795|nr:hypothetical protein [Ferriphaselus sp. R-1]
MNFNKSLIRTVTLVVAAALVQGCSTATHFEGITPGTTLSLDGHQNVALPTSIRLGSKATGQHLFKAVSAGDQKLYGLLPLHVNGSTIAGSILFFAPALFIGGFRDTFPYYQMDPEAGVIRYKMKEGEEWRLSKPTTAESDRAKAFFDSKDTK